MLITRAIAPCIRPAVCRYACSLLAGGKANANVRPESNKYNHAHTHKRYAATQEALTLNVADKWKPEQQTEILPLDTALRFLKAYDIPLWSGKPATLE
ncbi:hypothetical protein SARC_17929, partial [Sphaeroforma arctica JP610]